MSWIPKFIRFQNLFTHSDTTYKFNTGNMDMLLGVNKDDVGSNSNGAGKSTVIEAITLAITAEVYRGVSKEDYIKYGEDFCVVDFELRNDILDETLNIKRRIFNNTKPAKLEIYMNGKMPEHLPTSTNGGVDIKIGNKYIFDVLGISREDFLNYYVIGQGNSNSFFTANDTKQKEIISRFSNFTAIDNLISELSAIDKLYDSEITEYKSSIDSCDELIEYFNDEIKTKKENFTETKKKQISDKKIEINNISEKINKIAEKAKNNEKTLKLKQTELSKIEIPDVLKIESKIKKQKSSISTIEDDIDESKELLSNLKSKNGEIIECPKCEHKFIPDEDMSIEEISDMIDSLDELIESKKSELEDEEKSLKKTKNSLNSVNELKSKKKTLSNEIESYSEILTNDLEDLEKYKKRLKNLHKELVEIGKKTLKEDICEIESKLKKQEDKKTELLGFIKDIQDKKDENQFHLFHFGKKGFKTYLANKSIRTIQDICNFYLQKFDTNLQVQISGYTILKSGEVRDKIEISVLKNGLSKGLFNKYSGGEKSRINVAGIIAINRLINNGCGERGLDLIILDEIVSGLDSTGQNEIIRILSKSKITTVLVMHQVDDIPYKYKVYVEKQNNNSVIIQ